MKIGLFDSGIGGLSILGELLNDCPFEEITYVADLAHMPYGNLSPEEVIQRGRFITTFFLEKEITTLIVACHTSSAVALTTLKKEFPEVTFIDALLPTIIEATLATKNTHIGIFATPTTIASHTHKKLLLEQNSNLFIFEEACPEFVPLLESNASQETLTNAVKIRLNNLLKNTIDTLILGCTHYAFLKDIIQQQAPNVKLISANLLVPNLFKKNKTQEETVLNFFATADLEQFKKQSVRLLKKTISHQSFSFL